MLTAVTGGSGFLGAHIVDALCRSGHRPRLLVRSPDAATRSLDALGVDRDRYEVTVGDVADPAAVDRLLDGVDALVHAAAVVGVDDREAAQMWRVNVQATTMVLTKAVSRGIDPVVHVSSYSALFPAEVEPIGPDTPPAEGRSAYARSKAAADRVVRGFQQAGAPISSLYPTGIIGPPAGDRKGMAADAWTPLLRYGMSISFDGGMWMIDVRDVADLTVAALEPGRGPRRFVCGGEVLGFDEIVDVLAETTGRHIRRVPVSRRLLLGIGRATDAASKVLPVPPLLTYEAAWLLTSAQRTDDSAALSVLGRPWRSARQALRDSVAPPPHLPG